MKITNALQDVWARDPVLGALISKMEIIEDDGKTDMMSTDGVGLRINTTWAGSLTRNQLTLILAHEALHVARCHNLRRCGTNEEWQKAADMAINHELVNWPGSSFIDECGTSAANQNMPEGLAAEEYVKMLHANGKEEQPKPQNQSDQEGEGQGQGQSTPRTAQDGPNDKDKVNTQPGKENASESDLGGKKLVFRGDIEQHPEKDAAKAQAEQEQSLMEAIELGEQAGNLPSWAKELKAKLTEKPKLNWRVLLRQWMIRRAKIRRTFERPSRRQAVLGGKLIRPGRGGKTLGKVAVLVDVSGSMNRFAGKLEEAVAEIRSLLNCFPNAEVQIIQWSDKVVESKKLRQEKHEWKWKVGGGTLIKPAIKEAKAFGADIQIIWTDGELFDCPTRMEIPSLWCMVSKRQMAKHLGETINV